MIAPRTCRAALAVLALLATARPAAAADRLRLERIDTVKAPVIRFFLSYVDVDGRLVSGKAKEDFKILLDSADQGAATALATYDTLQPPEPLHVVAVVQLSGAMTEALEDMKKGVRSLADAIGPKGKMALLGYSSETKRLAELGPAADAEGAAAQIAIDNEGVEVRMIDAVRTATDLLNAAPKGERKLIVLFSDGIDINLDRKSFIQAGKRALDGGIVIDTVGYAPFEPARLRFLAELAKQSNGSDRTCKAASEVSTQFGNIADEIKKQYVATFEVALAGGDGKDHTFQAVSESAGRYSNTVIAPLPKAARAAAVVGGRPWWVWALGGLALLLLVLLVLWLIFRRREAAPEAQAPAPVAAKPQRTMAFDVGGRQVVLAWIVPLGGPQALTTMRLKSGRTLIGTGGDCDLVIDDQFMSTQHCEVRFEAGNFKLVDLNSTNGIVVNDKKVREHELVDNDAFRLGRTDFKFKSVG